MGKVIGIDLGTTNSVVAVMEGGEPTVIANKEGSRTTPSVVSFTPQGERLVGQPAKAQAVVHPDRTISSVKRLMGTRERVTIDGKEYSPEEISAMILQKLKADAESYLGEKVTQAVITVPAYFDDAQRTATKNAGQIAGLEVLRIINEPTAASLAYGLDRKEEETILVYDLGGGTFDVSLLEVSEGLIEVKATSGDTRLGGDDLDERIIEWLADKFKSDHGIDLRKDRQALKRLKEAAEKAKCELSSTVTTTITLPFVSANEDGPLHLETTLTRAELENLIGELIDKTRGPFRQALKDSGLDKGEIDEVVLVGGSTRIPAVQELVTRESGKDPCKGVNPDEVVAVGAAIQAAVLSGEMKDVVLLDVTPLSLGLETLGGVSTKLIERNTTIPVRKTETFTTAADGQTSVEVHVLQGEREMARFNRSLGRFQLSDIPPAPRGIPQIDVQFDIDRNGILNVSAKDKATGKETSIQIAGSSQLSNDEIEKMVDEAEKHAEEDGRLREEADTRNTADSLVYQIERTMGDLGDDVSDEDKQRVREAIQKVKDLREGGDIPALKTAIDELQQASYSMSEVLYKKAAAQAQAEQAPEGGPAEESPAEASASSDDEDVIDAEFKAE